MVKTDQDQVIAFTDVFKEYSQHLGRPKTNALTGLSLEVHRGEVFGIIGLNGAGKSTALKILMGFVTPTHGTVTLFGKPGNSIIIHEKIGFLPETPCLYRNLTAAEHLRFAAQVGGIPSKILKARTAFLLEQLGLSRFANLPIGKYSKGMIQRASLAFALIHEPEVLVLDEPMSGLDPLGRQLIMEIIRNYNQKGHTILFCSHILTDVERICDRIGIMHQGKLLQTISPAGLPPSDQNLPRRGNSPLESLFLNAISGAE